MVKLKDLSDFDKDQIVMLGVRTYSASQLVGYGAVQPETGQGAHADLCPQLKANTYNGHCQQQNQTTAQWKKVAWSDNHVFFFFYPFYMRMARCVCITYLGKIRTGIYYRKKARQQRQCDGLFSLCHDGSGLFWGQKRIHTILGGQSECQG